VINIIKDKNLFEVPILILFDKSNENNLNSFEKLKFNLTQLDSELINTQYVDFDNNIKEIYYGLDWLSENMKAL
jgi:hypothetical protein